MSQRRSQHLHLWVGYLLHHSAHSQRNGSHVLLLLSQGRSAADSTHIAQQRHRRTSNATLSFHLTLNRMAVFAPYYLRVLRWLESAGDGTTDHSFHRSIDGFLPELPGPRGRPQVRLASSTPFDVPSQCLHMSQAFRATSVTHCPRPWSGPGRSRR